MSRLYLKNDAFVTDGSDSKLLFLLYLVQVRFWAVQNVGDAISAASLNLQA